MEGFVEFVAGVIVYITAIVILYAIAPILGYIAFAILVPVWTVAIWRHFR